jgi:hypothetical protein
MSQKNTYEDQYMTLGRAAKITGLTYGTVLSIVDQGLVDTARIKGGYRLVKPSAVAAVLARSIVPAREPSGPCSTCQGQVIGSYQES